MPHARTVVLAVLALGSVITLGVAAQQPAPFEPSDPEVIASNMGLMADSIMDLRDALDGRDAAAALGHLESLQLGIIHAKARTPDVALELAGEEQAAMTAAFRNALVAVLAATCRAERLLLEGDWEGAAEIINVELNQMEGDGHERFAP